MPRRRETQDRRVTVIGLGRFGRSVVRALYELGYEVTAIDRDERRVEEASDVVALATQGDGSDEELLRSLQVERSPVAIVAQGTHLESSVMATLVLKRLGVPYLVAKANTELHGEILRRVGADRVIFPSATPGSGGTRRRRLHRALADQWRCQVHGSPELDRSYPHGCARDLRRPTQRARPQARAASHDIPLIGRAHPGG